MLKIAIKWLICSTIWSDKCRIDTLLYLNTYKCNLKVRLKRMNREFQVLIIANNHYYSLHNSMSITTQILVCYGKVIFWVKWNVSCTRLKSSVNSLTLISKTMLCSMWFRARSKALYLKFCRSAGKVQLCSAVICMLLRTPNRNWHCHLR